MMQVSILIPCFNAERWIAQAIESALAQTWPDREVIVVDDGSTDGSIEVIRRFEDRIKWESGPNQGSNVTRNRLLNLANGDWLQYLDADDYLMPFKIANQAGFLASRQDVDVVFGPVTLDHTTRANSRLELLPIPQPHDPWVLLARWYLPQTGAPLWRKQAIEDVGGWKPDQPACQEHELYLRLLMAGKRFCYFESNGAVYRQWSETTLWKADKPRTRRLRLEIEQRAEAFLRSRSELTADRLWAINQARFETARLVWQVDPAEAIEVAKAINRSQPGFVPAGEAAPESYRRLYRWFGFAATERIADVRRRWTPSSKAS
jgi:glycosyltransferase involved in cell wall biosynthesis